MYILQSQSPVSTVTISIDIEKSIARWN
uniref:Uncharacterized protein n=1 Tax=Arundo donax TaxID=35708 RepID=A0A0A9AEU6_ARUDO